MTTTQDQHTAAPTVDESKVEAFAHQIIGDLGAGMSGILIHIGDRLGLYRAMGDSRPVTSTELAVRTRLAERYVREWLHNQASAGWVTYAPAASPADATFTLPAEHALLIADDQSPAFMLGGFDFIASGWADEETTENAFRTGEGIGWHQHDHRLFTGTERFFKPGYRANLIDGWLPALDGVLDRLESGIRVADVGCGFGAATILLADRFPNSTFVGFDYHDASVASARSRAADADVDDRLTFEVAGAKDFAGSFDLICLFDCLHDMGDPVGAAKHVHDALAPGGSLLLVEPNAADRPEDNHHLLGRLFYAASTMICMPGSLAQEVGLGLGNQVGFARLSSILGEAGFSSVKLATNTPVNLVIDAKR
jgi:SAM-dependent methyltransferase